MKKIKFLLFALVCCLYLPVMAQVRVQVVSKKVSENIPWKEGMSVHLNGEQAEIVCTTHPTHTIQLEMTIISKHENQSTAEADLKKMKWITENKGNKIYLRNYVELGRGETKPESALKVVYNLKIPEGCPLDIRNYFGSIDIKNVKSGLKINSEFSKIGLENVRGITDIQSTFGDINCSDTGGDISILSNRSDIAMNGLTGNIDLDASVAEIKLGNFGNVKKLKIKAEKSVIDLNIPQFDRFAFSLDLKDCDFQKPELINMESSQEDPSKIKANFQVNSNKPLVTINLNLGSLAINP
ncbi:MAG: DUF4097 family beta strand repeat protein [Bacteroidales bacterium]|nr:DUF4097 family beta strand repeat protein [Bacteroidales bacterium]